MAGILFWQDENQCIVDFENTDERILKRITTGAAIAVKGILTESLGKGQNVEIQISEIEILGDSNPEEYPIQPKKHSFEFLRENAHLRIRTNTFSASPTRATIFGPIGIWVKMKMADIAIPAGESRDTNILRIIQSAFTLFV